MNWLLLRGLGREQRHWHDFPERLRRRVEPDGVHLLDLAGTGTEHARWPVPSVPWLARDVARRLRGAEPCASDARGSRAQPWGVIGLSLGGMVALELCWLWAHQIACAVVINSSARITSPLARLEPRALPGLGRALLATRTAEREAQLLALTSNLPREQRQMYAGRAAVFERTPRAGALLSQLCAAGSFSPPAPDSLSAQLWFLGSRRDRLVSVECSRDLAQRYRAPYLEHPWAGHDLPLDDPEWVCDCVSRVRLS